LRAGLEADSNIVSVPLTAGVINASYSSKIKLIGDAVWKIPWTPISYQNDIPYNNTI